jgi:hypothetical protein
LGRFDSRSKASGQSERDRDALVVEAAKRRTVALSGELINRPKADRFVDASNSMAGWRKMPVFGSFLVQISFILVKRR